MMTNFGVGVIFGIGAGVWVYNKMMRSTGGRTKDAAIVAGIAGLAGLAVVTLLLGMLFR